MNNPKISIILPLYNPVLKFFKLTLESIFKQTYQQFEVIIIDDSDSPILNKKVLSNFQEEKIIHYIPSKKLGLSKALNKGISIAKGEFIARFDADDIYDKKRLEIQLNFLVKNEYIDVCGTNCVKIDLNGNQIGLRKFPEKDKKIKQRLHLTNALAHPTLMIRKTFFDKYGNYSVHENIEDYELWLRAKQNGCKFYNIQKNLCKLRVFEGNDFSRPRHWKDNFLLKLKYADKKYPFSSINGLIIFGFISLLPNKFAIVLQKLSNFIR